MVLGNEEAVKDVNAGNNAQAPGVEQTLICTHFTPYMALLYDYVRTGDSQKVFFTLTVRDAKQSADGKLIHKGTAEIEGPHRIADARDVKAQCYTRGLLEAAGCKPD